MELYPLLSLLADGEFHSGSTLGKNLGVSRTSIWKSLGRLSEINLDVESVKGRGYRIKGGLDLLDLEQIRSSLALRHRDLLGINLLTSVDSTNNWLMKQNISSLMPYMACLSEIQSAGKGRRGRSWLSPFGKNIYLSVGFDLAGGVEVINGLSLVIGLAVVRALHSLGVNEAKLKWPNDVWINDKKIAGVLVELQGEATTSWRVTAGLGLNVHMSRKEGQSINQGWSTLSEYSSVTRSELAGVLLNSLIDTLEVFKQKGFAAFMSEWRDIDCLHGRHIELSNGGVQGVASGVDITGALLVLTHKGLETINAGEVSVRPV